MTDDNFHKLALNESFERVAKVAEERAAFNDQMTEKRSKISDIERILSEADRCYERGECARCCGNGQTYGPNSGEDIICPDCNGKGRI